MMNDFIRFFLGAVHEFVVDESVLSWLDPVVALICVACVVITCCVLICNLFKYTFYLFRGK